MTDTDAVYFLEQSLKSPQSATKNIGRVAEYTQYSLFSANGEYFIAWLKT